MIVARSSYAEIGRYWYIVAVAREYMAIMVDVDGVNCRRSDCADLDSALDAVLEWQCAQ